MTFKIYSKFKAFSIINTTEVVEAVRTLIHISYDIFHDSILVPFEYFDRAKNILSWSPLSLGTGAKCSIGWVQHAPHSICSTGIRSEAWMWHMGGIFHKNVGKNILQGWVAKGDNTLPKKIHPFFGCWTLIFFPLFLFLINAADMVFLFALSAPDGKK